MTPSMNLRDTVPCEASECRQKSLVRMPDDSNLCDWHCTQWWKNNHSKAEKRVTSNPVCDEIRSIYAAKHGARESLRKLGEELDERMAA